MTESARQFEQIALPHLPAAYNLARWLLRDTHDADDVVQEAYLRAFRFFDDLRGNDARPWLLGIVRNACYDWMRQHRRQDEWLEFDEERDSEAASEGNPRASGTSGDPLTALDERDRRARIDQALRLLPPPYREVIVLREMEDMSYDEISRLAGIPIGTVMSRLSRARAAMRRLLQDSDGPMTRDERKG